MYFGKPFVNGPLMETSGSFLIKYLLVVIKKKEQKKINLKFNMNKLYPVFVV